MLVSKQADARVLTLQRFERASSRASRGSNRVADAGEGVQEEKGDEPQLPGIKPKLPLVAGGVLCLSSLLSIIGTAAPWYTLTIDFFGCKMITEYGLWKVTVDACGTTHEDSYGFLDGDAPDMAPGNQLSTIFAIIVFLICGAYLVAVGLGKVPKVKKNLTIVGTVAVVFAVFEFLMALGWCAPCVSHLSRAPRRKDLTCGHRRSPPPAARAGRAPIATRKTEQVSLMIAALRAVGSPTPHPSSALLPPASRARLRRAARAARNTP